MRRDFLEPIGWHLVLGGLLMVFITAILTVFRGDDPTATWQAFLQIYLFAFVMLFGGIGLLKWIGTWPSQ